ncbi:lmo0937 family membrane protein [Lacihabitans sp. LS3-19]|uniref:lmo0937 family membrane protein n=1 Tax=Lacihabitans sp. LS3-19 TaxID=2487335 RepID=UPI0020CD8499|nr:lmo0937 family membrane protein [Lacihabitans sp. LS3-19]MCP9767050.1 lmo0937 family membrane protein [Lacihabitans sp. LS3-19]
MSNLLYLIAVVLIISWAVGFFAYGAGGLIHVLLVIAIVAVLLRLISGRKILK